jgi:hypothetical protein
VRCVSHANRKRMNAGFPPVHPVTLFSQVLDDERCDNVSHGAVLGHVVGSKASDWFTV